MLKLLKCEFKKFRSTYINSLAFLGMLMPIALVTLVFFMKKNDFIKAEGYNWENFNQQLSIFFVFLVGPIITSFIAVFSVFYEYQQKTIKNVLTSPHGRMKIILVKITYVSMFVLLQYVLVACANILCAFCLGFEISPTKLIENSTGLILAGLSTVVIIPLMMFVTLLFKSFIPALVLTVIGTVSNVLTLNWEKSYLSPWAIPADLSGIIAREAKMNILYPVISTCCYFVLFMLITIVFFKRADQSV